MLNPNGSGNMSAKRMSAMMDRDNPPDNMPVSNATFIPIYTKYMGSINSNKKLFYIESNTTLGHFKEEIARLNPEHTVKRVLFGGRPLGANDDNKKLADLKIYKECTIQIMTAKKSASEMAPVAPKKPKGARLRRAATEDFIQYGDCAVIRVIEGRGLLKVNGQLSNPYCVLQHGQQYQSGTVRRSTVNPKFNETFGFFIDMIHGNPKTDSISISLYHHDFATRKQQPMGKFQMKVSDLPRNKQVNHFCKLDSGTGEVLVSIYRNAIPSPDLAGILKQVVNQKKPWTKEMLDKLGVKLGALMGTEPWALPDDNTKNPALDHLLKIMNRNQLNFTNARTLEKVEKILHSQKTVVTEDAPCQTVYFSDLLFTEKELFEFLTKAVPNGVKSVFYNEPCKTLEDIGMNLSSMSLDDQKKHSHINGYCVVQFKSTMGAVRALISMALKGHPFVAGFGPPKEADEDGVIATSAHSMIEGFLQVSTPKYREEKEKGIYANHQQGLFSLEEEEEAKNDENHKPIGESFYGNDMTDEEEFPQYWVRIADDSVAGYMKLQNLDPTFQINIQECQCRKSGEYTFDLIDQSTNETFQFRSTNPKVIALWSEIISQAVDGRIKFDAGLAIEKRQNNPDRWMNHQCYLSKKDLPLSLLYSPDGHKWFADRKMLNQYVRNFLQNGKLDLISTRFTVQDLKDLLSREAFELYAEKSLRHMIDSGNNQFIRCPHCKNVMEVEPYKGQLTPEEQIALDKLSDEDGKKLDKQAKQHFTQNRIRCTNSSCLKDFCKKCWETPYHLGQTCESLRAKKSAPKCRFCWKLLNDSNRIPNPISRALSDVCTDKECQEQCAVCATDMLECGHPSNGVRDEVEPSPCLWKDCPSFPKHAKTNNEEDCCICYTDKLGQRPACLLPCGHAFHYNCLKKKLEMGWPKQYIDFDYSNCPLCKAPIDHPALADLVDPIRLMENRVREMALKRLKYEGKENEDDIVKEGGRFYQDPVGYAEHYYAFFQCWECKEPYFGGAKECGPQDQDEKVSKEDLICTKCQKIESVNTCDEHGSEYIAFKCRYCCTLSVYHCWGKVHFCRTCHEPGTWDKLSTYSTGKNKKNIEDYQQCDGLKIKIAELKNSPDWPKWNREQKDAELYKLRADPGLCPLETRHPPNGFEFGLGCTLCGDKGDQQANQLAKMKVERELRNHLKKVMKFMTKLELPAKFVHKHPLDENGILYYFGSAGTRQAANYSNPAKQGMVIVATSEMMPDSEPYAALVGRKAVRCVTKPSASCWFSVDFIDKFVKPTHYTLRHYISWDTECLRNWVIEGSVNGEDWLVLRQHQNDQALNYKGQAYTWALHDYGCAFRRFRVKQTGPNNNNHYFLACSGFEVYGTLYQESHAGLQEGFQKAFDEQQKMRSLSLVRFWQMLEAGQPGVYHFTYDSDFDENGILYFLGSSGGQVPYQNPAIRDEVAVCSSALVKDSVPIHYFVDRETKRLVTKPEDNAWMQVDFKDKLIQPSYYTLRHYESWDTECLRNWILQASNDGIHWVTVKKHEEDTSLSEKGAAHTWPVQSRGAYRIWRIKQTGLNSNKHKYLACSGIEFYGQLFLTKFDPLAGVRNRPQCEQTLSKLKKVKTCEFKENNDTNGIIYWVGTRGGRSHWVNPGARGWVRCEASTLMRDSEPVHSLCGRISVRCVTQPLENSWFSVDLKNLYITPTHYSIRHYISWDTEALRNWVLEASFDGQSWITLRAHRNDGTIAHKGSTYTWSLRAKGARYRAFRLRQTGVNSNNHFYLACSGFEIYGTVYQVAYPQPRVPVNAPQNGGSVVPNGNGEDVSRYDPSVTGQVPWDDSPDNDASGHGANGGGPGAGGVLGGGAAATGAGGMSISAGPGGGGAGPVSAAADEEDQSMAFLREMARQEKQRLIHHLTSGNPYPFYYSKDFDESGILYFLGTNWRTEPWMNPAERGVVTVTSSRLVRDSTPASAICGREVVRCVCVAEKNNWFMIDFRNIYIKPTHYTLKHYNSWDTECLRNWYLEASNDLKKFKVIKTHKKDKALYGKGSTHTWKIDTENKRYRAFRIRQFGHNSNKHWYLSLSGVEFYGEIYFRPN